MLRTITNHPPVTSILRSNVVSLEHEPAQARHLLRTTRTHARSAHEVMAWASQRAHALEDQLRRCLDVFVAAGVLFLGSPLFVLIALAIRLQSPGPVLFTQTRVGRGGRSFRMFKFRSMRIDAEERRSDVIGAAGQAQSMRFKSQSDPRITPIGRLLRRWSLDEMPQLLNVLRGDMALVGPRPPIPEETNRYSPSEWRRLDVRPGLTCFWQVRGRAEIDFDGQVEMDLEYIERRSLALDLGLLLRTVPAVVGGKGAY